MSSTPQTDAERNRAFFSTEGRLKRMIADCDYLEERNKMALTPETRAMLEETTDIFEQKTINAANDELDKYKWLDSSRGLETTEVYNFYQLAVWMRAQLLIL